jgi:hypothetical protein
MHSLVSSSVLERAFILFISTHVLVYVLFYFIHFYSSLAVIDFGIFNL